MSWQDRAEKELSKLEKKMHRLDAFLEKDQTGKVDPYSLNLLYYQKDCMEKYADILRERLLVGNKPPRSLE